jgi:cysteine desulfurase
MDHMSACATTYLDHGATTPLRSEVADAMAEARSIPLGNPTGSHRPAQRARRLLEESRDEVAAALGREPGDIIFTSGGTESANLAVLGTLGAAVAGGGGAVSVVSSSVEHPAVRESCRAAVQLHGVSWCELAVDHDGVVELDALADLIDDSTRLIAIMLANNETGVVQPLDAVIETARARSATARIFTDAVQASSRSARTRWEDPSGWVCWRCAPPPPSPRSTMGGVRNASGAAVRRTLPGPWGWPPHYA